MVCAYIVNVPVITKHNFSDHLKVIKKFYRKFQKQD